MDLMKDWRFLASYTLQAKSEKRWWGEPRHANASDIDIMVCFAGTSSRTKACRITSSFAEERILKASSFKENARSCTWRSHPTQLGRIRLKFVVSDTKHPSRTNQCLQVMDSFDMRSSTGASTFRPYLCLSCLSSRTWSTLSNMLQAQKFQWPRQWTVHKRSQLGGASPTLTATDLPLQVHLAANDCHKGPSQWDLFWQADESLVPLWVNTIRIFGRGGRVQRQFWPRR